MMKSVFIFFVLDALLFISPLEILAQTRRITWNEQPKSFSFHEGIVCTDATRIKYKKNGKTKAVIKLSKPIIIGMAENEEPWGYYQFPSIGKDENGVLLIGWSMIEDSHTTYGQKTKRKEPSGRVSFDGGKTWQTPVNEYNTRRRAYNAVLRNGDYITVDYPAAKDITKYNSFPKPIEKFSNYSFYKTSQLPDDLQGAYLVFLEHNTKQGKAIHAHIDDPGLVRYAIDNLMPINWWGNIKELKDGSLMAGVYPCQYINSKEKVLPGGISFYRTTDCGENWRLQGHIPYVVNKSIGPKEEAFVLDGFTEPAFEVMPDGTFVCVMRTGGNTPMYSSLSKDQGKTWTTPQAIAPNGVFPQLMLLDNGVLVLASGRPGLQLRFCLDGTGENWTDPIDMMNFMGDNGAPDIYASCGYAALMPINRNTFFLVYSDFHTKNLQGEDRKSIKLRKITVNKR